MPTFSLSRTALAGVAAVVATLLTAFWTFAAAPAVAGPLDPIQIDQTDPVGDNKTASYQALPGVDITGFSITQDRAAKVVRGTVTFSGNVEGENAYGVRIGLGLVSYGACNISEGYGWVHIRHDLGNDLADYVVATNTDVRQDVKVTRSDKQFSFETPAGPGIFDGRGFRCIVVQTERILSPIQADFYHPEDSAVGYAPPEDTTPAAVVDPGNGIPAVILDADNDGVHDGIDKCPNQPGAATNGCETVPLAKSIRLGTKRLVVDRLMETTAGNCPSTVKVVVTLGKVSLARVKVGTLKKGKFCHVLSVVTLKKKVAKARVVITGAGVTSVVATVAK